MSILSQMLNDMVIDALAQRNRPFTRKLSNGLHITITNIGDEFALTISRDNVYPSLNEFVTVLNHWPYFLETKEQPNQEMERGRKCLKAKITKIGLNQLKFA